MEPENKCDKPGSHAKQKQTINLKIKLINYDIISKRRENHEYNTC